MSRAQSSSRSSPIERQSRSGLLSGLSIMPIIHAIWINDISTLPEKESASTLYRFFSSKHVVDLKLIFLAVFLLAVVTFGAFCLQFFPHMFSPAFDRGLCLQIAAYAGPILAVCGVVAAWAYRSASARLGVVDLFGCEISTLCRVGTIFELSSQFAAKYFEKTQTSQETNPTAGKLANFVSNEAYFPVFDSGTRDLQLLDVTVVSNITEFYTYMKAMRDCMRRLATLQPFSNETASPDRPESSLEPSQWQITVRETIYMLFLAYESGRQAVDDLIEFEPYSSERKIVIYCTELPAYHFLINQFPASDTRHERLAVRQVDYQKAVPELYWRVMDESNKGIEWRLAQKSARLLAIRYEEAIGESMEVASVRLGYAK